MMEEQLPTSQPPSSPGQPIAQPPSNTQPAAASATMGSPVADPQHYLYTQTGYAQYYTQQQPQPSMYGTQQQQQPLSATAPSQGLARREYGTGWSTGLLECLTEMNVCLDVWLCPCCNISRQLSAADGLDDTMKRGVCWCAALGFLPIAICLIRCRVTEMFNIPENCCVSCLAGGLCGHCSAAQTHRELLVRNRFPGGTCWAKRRPLGMIVSMGQEVAY